MSPPEDHPDHAECERLKSVARTANGLIIYMGNVVPEIVGPNNVLCGCAGEPSNELCVGNPEHNHLRALRHIAMWVMAHAGGIAFGGDECSSLEGDAPMLNPFTVAKREYRLWSASDASPKGKGISGGVVMLGGGPIMQISQRVHLVCPDVHSVEMASAGTLHTCVVPINGVLQELMIRRGRPTPFILDSGSVVFSVTNDRSVRRSTWLLRRAAPLQEAEQMKQIEPLKVRERDMVADPYTKYLKLDVWVRHFHIVCNKPGDPPNPVPLEESKLSRRDNTTKPGTYAEAVKAKAAVE